MADNKPKNDDYGDNSQFGDVKDNEPVRETGETCSRCGTRLTADDICIILSGNVYAGMNFAHTTPETRLCGDCYGNLDWLN